MLDTLCHILCFGIWRNGTWENGFWYDGLWKDGSWKNGTWYEGEWMNGTWYEGIWENGEWKDGIWLYGNWYGGAWLKGIWEAGFINGEFSRKPPQIRKLNIMTKKLRSENPKPNKSLRLIKNETILFVADYLMRKL